MSEILQFRIRGYSERNTLKVWPGISSSAEIEDGVAMEHDDDGLFVLAFSDLEKIYVAAKHARTN